MRPTRFNSAALAVLVLVAGCTSTRSIGGWFSQMVVETLLDSDIEKMSPENRRHWEEATSGGWDGVHQSVDY